MNRCLKDEKTQDIILNERIEAQKIIKLIPLQQYLKMIKSTREK